MSAALASASGPAPMGVDRGSSPSTPAQQRARLDRLQDLDGGALREEWRRFCHVAVGRTRNVGASGILGRCDCGPPCGHRRSAKQRGAFGLK